LRPGVYGQIVRVNIVEDRKIQPTGTYRVEGGGWMGRALAFHVMLANWTV
jgi:hypothetical protein